jgi:acetyl-CoA carboxylase carboxyltransferase component
MFKADPTYQGFNYQTAMQPNAFQNFASVASPVASIAGIGLQAYGSYKQNQQMEKQYELQRKMWEAEQERLREQEAKQARQLELDNALKYGGYAQGEEDRALASYGNYASRVGM